MAKVYGVCNHSPDQIMQWLDETFNVKSKHISVLPLNKRISKTTNTNKIKKIVIVLSASDLQRNIDSINEFLNDRIFFVLSSPISCHRYANIPIIDAEKIKNTALHGYHLTTLRSDKVDLTPSSEPIHKSIESNYLSAVIESTKNFGSILNTLMTFIYLLPSSTHQRPVKNAVCNWIYYGGDADSLDFILNKVDKYATLSARVKDRLREILLSDVGKSYRDAFALYRQGLDNKKDGKAVVSVSKLAEKFAISAYDMRYIKNIVDTKERYRDLEKVTIQEFLNHMSKSSKPVTGLGSKKAPTTKTSKIQKKKKST